MFATNGYRTFTMTVANKISRARKCIATYQVALDTGLNFDGTHTLTVKDRAFVVTMIEDQNEVIVEAKAMAFHPGEW